jgi:hypothetical protein
MLMLTACAASAADRESQKNVYLLRVDRANQRISLFDSVRKRIPIEVEYKDESGKPVRETLNSLPVLTKTVRFIAPEGPQIPNDPYGKYCESPPADGRDGMWYHVGPIIDIPEGSMDFGYYKVRITGKPADIHGRTGLLLHGGGKNRPNPLAEFQGWQCTHGCIRLQNAHMRALVQTLRSLPQDAEIRLIIDGGKCKLNDITAETYRWNEERADWDILEAE